ncbi:MAG TPA: PadR family transcriptional regulator [Acidimicrobiia bacterium]|nr:PadR family transcriptional regulator [Acidimicrobiia bacterium]
MKTLTDAELLVLGLVAEMPRHGYELEQVIEERGMREWAQIGFSSIYFVLGKLEKLELVTAEEPAAAKAKKVFRVTDSGRVTLAEQSLAALRTVRPSYPSLLLGMAHWPVLKREAALAALQERGVAVAAERKRLGDIQVAQQPLPDFIEALFDYALGQLRTEARWVRQTLDYMTAKPWLEEVHDEHA